MLLSPVGGFDAMIEKVRETLDAARRAGRSALLEHEVYAVLSAAGFAVPRFAFWEGEPGTAPPAAVAELVSGAPGGVVLKIVSPEILHKSDVGGVAVAPGDPAAVASAARRVWDDVGRGMPGAARSGVLVVEKVKTVSGSPASETLLSLKQDPAFGPVLVLGLGGVLTEWYGEVAGGASTVVLQPGRVREGLESAVATRPAVALLFRPSRLHAKAPLDLAATAERLEALGAVATAFGELAQAGEAEPLTLEELEVNPLLLAADGRWIAVDGKGRIGRATAVLPKRPLRKVKNLLEPRSAAVLGASATAMNPGRIILRNLKLSEGVRYGHIWAVHPKEEAIDGIPCVRTVADLPQKVDVAVVSIPAEGARDAIRALCETGKAESIILIPGGFAETGKKALEEEIVSIVRASRSRPDEGPGLVGGNCLGIVSKHQYNTFFLPQYKLPFHDAPGDRLLAVSQSGAYLVSLTSNLDGIIFPKASISYGNQMDLTVSDFLDAALEDDGVKVVACYIEGFKPLDATRFVDLARRLRGQGKRVLAFKAGKTPLAAKATQSHTASLAGDYAVAEALMEGAGVVVARTLDMLEDYTKAFTMLYDRLPCGNRVAVLSNAGFECSSVLDKLYGLVPAPLTDETKAKLEACLPGVGHAGNPADATPMATTAQFVAAAQAMVDDPTVDLLLVSPVPVTPALDNLAPDLSGTHRENIHSPGSLPNGLLELFRNTSKPVAVAVDSGRLYDDFVFVLQRGGIPVWRKIDRASRALSALATL
jgi:acyl-CoA synthetase (NDP forming)